MSNQATRDERNRLRRAILLAEESFKLNPPAVGDHNAWRDQSHKTLSLVTALRRVGGDERDLTSTD